MSPSDAWLQVQVLTATSTHREFCDFLFDWVEDQFDAKNAQTLNQFLELAQPAELPVERCCTILRASSRARHLLPNWAVFQQKAADLYGNLPEFDRLFRGIK